MPAEDTILEKILNRLTCNAELDSWVCEYDQHAFVNTFVLKVSPIDGYTGSTVNIQTGTFNTDRLYLMIDKVIITCEDNDGNNQLSLLFKKLQIKLQKKAYLINQTVKDQKQETLSKNLYLL